MANCEACGRELSVSKSDQKLFKGKYSALCPCQYEKKRFRGPGDEIKKGKRHKVNDSFEDIAESLSPEDE